jgi:hypothetical protein
LAVGWHGGVRVRILEGVPEPCGVVRGRTPGPPPDRLLQIVLDLKPAGAGTVDLIHDGRNNWQVRATGALAEPGFRQRLRNVLALP